MTKFNTGTQLNQKITKVLAIAVMIGGIIVIIGWVFGISTLTSIQPQWVTMKFSTSLSFLCGGIILYSLAKYQEGKIETAQLGLSLCTLVILLLMTPLFISVLLGVRTGIEDFIIREQSGAVGTTTPGRPSIGTMIDFLLITLSALMILLNPKRMRRLPWIGIIVLVIGGIAIVGYAVNVPALYYEVKGWSTAMAVHTATFFVMLGAGLIVLTKGSAVLKLGGIKYEN